MQDIGFIVAVKGLSATIKEMWKFCCKVYNTIIHPKDALISAIDASYWFLLISAMVCLILTMCGCKKTKNGTMISILIYIILQCLRSALKTL